jgi:hypothetical protein
MDGYDEKMIGTMDLCEYCWANGRIKTPHYSHGSRPSRAEMLVSCWYQNEFSDFLSGLKEMTKTDMPPIYAAAKKLRDLTRSK